MLNKVMLIGRLGKSPELRYTPSGVPVVNFTLATNRKWKDKSGNFKDETTWHNIVVIGKQAEIASNYLKKGALVFIEGRIQSRSWDDKDGNKHYRTEIMAESFRFLERKDADTQPSDDAEHIPDEHEIHSESSTEAVDDVPF